MTVNKEIPTIDQVLDDALDQKIVTSNVAAKVARVSTAQKDVDTLTVDEVDHPRA